MKNILLVVVLCCLAAACNPDKNKRAEQEKLRFQTSDDAEIFFKNMRRVYYDHQEMAAAKLDVFRHEDRNQEADYPLLYPALAVNWRYDEAYLILEPNAALGTNRPLEVEWRDSLQQKRGKYVLEGNNKVDQLRFASKLYEGILEGQQFFLATDSTQQPFLNQPEDREVFRISMFDYYRLTRNIQ